MTKPGGLGNTGTIALLLAGVLLASSALATSSRKSPAHHHHVARKPLDTSKLSPVPIEGARGLEPFAAALSSLVESGAEQSPRVVRILHFGDSHVDADFWTGELRRLFQARFGDGGAGYVMPGKPWRFFRHEAAKSTGKGWTTLGLGKEPGDGFLGLSGTAITPGSKDGFAGAGAACSGFEVQVGLPEGAAPLALWVDGEPAYCGLVGREDEAVGGMNIAQDSLAFGDNCQTIAYLSGPVKFPGIVHEVTVEPAGPGRVLLLGIDFLSGRSGVVYDSLGLIGTEIESLARWRPDVREALLRHASPSLIIVSYGTNDMGRGDFSAEDYQALCAHLLADLRHDAPGASVLVTGPVDRDARKRKTKALLKANESDLVEALRRAALETGCAFWDARKAMGGEGSIAAWHAAGLAQADLVHLTDAGYKRLAVLLYDQIMAACANAAAPQAQEVPAP